MRWFKPNLQSMHGILGRVSPAARADVETRTEQVRRTMLDTLADAGLDPEYRGLVSKIRYADSLRTLWYTRSDVMAALSAERGEALAQQHMAELSRLFVGLLPEARGYKPQQRPR